MIENTNEGDCLQRDSAEHKGHARVSRSFNLIWKQRLIDKGYYDLSNAYQSMHINY